MAITKKPFVVLTSSAVVGSLLLAGTAFAQTQPTPTSAPTGGWGRSGMMRKMPGVFGTVSAISGNTVTVSQTRMGRPDQTQESAPTIYSVDASNATITKNGSASSLSAIAVGDTVMVQGTVNGTSVTATAIRDGMPKDTQRENSDTHPMPATMQGNGQPVVGGTVSALNGNSFTLGTKAGTSYSVDATSATIIKQGATSTLSAISAGDTVVVQGAVNGTAISASSVMDQGAPRTPSATGTTNGEHPAGGFMGVIGGFFQHLFGFF